ncbi:MAG: LysR family transcriptional regulator [Erysipelotrichaceae bacterium]|nr:LysR family transcriptional regulator [Erysipelotrichaceae bacterium]
MKDKCFLNAEDVASFMDVPIPAACKIIRKLDDELKKPGHITVAGKISGASFESKACLSE